MLDTIQLVIVAASVETLQSLAAALDALLTNRHSEKIINGVVMRLMRALLQKHHRQHSKWGRPATTQRRIDRNQEIAARRPTTQSLTFSCQQRIPPSPRPRPLLLPTTFFLNRYSNQDSFGGVGSKNIPGMLGLSATPCRSLRFLPPLLFRSRSATGWRGKA